MSDDEKFSDGLLRLVAEAKAENLALQMICAALMAELAILTKSPSTKLSGMVAGLLGSAQKVGNTMKGETGEDITPAITKVIDRVCEMAEVLLPKGGRP